MRTRYPKRIPNRNQENEPVRPSQEISPATSSTSETAIDRTPIELWSQIIHLATFWDPIPLSDSPISAHLSFFLPTCARYHSYRQIAALRGRLRFVSRSWDAIIKNMPHELVVIGVNGEVWPAEIALPRATCIERAVNRDYCRCGKASAKGSQRGGLRLPIPHAFKRNWSHPQLFDSWDNRAKQARIYMGGFEMEAVDEWLEHIPPLNALLTRIAKSGSTIPWLTSSALRHLTHLDLYEIDPFEVLVPDKITLPSLLHLRLELLISIEETSTVHSTSQDSPQLLFQFHSPSLQVLLIDGFTRRSIQDIVGAFISKHSSTLEILVVSFMWVQDESTLTVWSAPSSFWDQLPLIRVFGVSLAWFIESPNSIPAPSISTPKAFPMTVIIHEFFVDYEWEPVSLTRCARNLMDWCASFPSGIEKIMVVHTWVEIASVIDHGGEGFEIARVFFDEIADGPIPFCDSDEIPLSDESARPFVDGLAMGRFPPGYLPRRPRNRAHAAALVDALHMGGGGIL